MKFNRVLMLLLPLVLSAPSFALAQMLPSIPLGGGEKQLTEEEKEAARRREDAARAASAKIPAQQKASNDPWAGARDVTPAQPATQLAPQKKNAAKK